MHSFFQPCFTWDWGEDKIKVTLVIPSVFPLWQINPLSNGASSVSAKTVSDQWIGLYLRQGYHHSVAAAMGGVRHLGVFFSVAIDGCHLLDHSVTKITWRGAKPSVIFLSSSILYPKMKSGRDCGSVSVRSSHAISQTALAQFWQNLGEWVVFAIEIRHLQNDLNWPKVGGCIICGGRHVYCCLAFICQSIWMEKDRP